jgi:hypothetical protein
MNQYRKLSVYPISPKDIIAEDRSLNSVGTTERSGVYSTDLIHLTYPRHGFTSGSAAVACTVAWTFLVLLEVAVARQVAWAEQWHRMNG